MTHQRDERGDPLTRTHDPTRKTYAAVEARQGFLGSPVLKVLAVSLCLAFLVWGALELWGGGVDQVDTTQTSSTTSEMDAPPADEPLEDIGETAPAVRDPATNDNLQ